MNETATRVGEVDPAEAWSILQSHPDAALVDVRTRAEWSYVGTPDLAPIGKQVVLAEWRRYPDMAVHPEFVADLRRRLDPLPGTILFICRSGARSREAAEALLAALDGAAGQPLCLNVAEGFEGSLDSAGHRGTANGWKARGLAWRQS